MTATNTTMNHQKNVSSQDAPSTELQAAEVKVAEAEKRNALASRVLNLSLLAYVIVTAILAAATFWGSRTAERLKAAERLLNDLQKEKIRADSLLKTEVETQKVREEAASQLQIRTAQANERAQNLALRIEEEARKRAEAEVRLERLRKNAAPRGISKTLEPLKGAKGRAEILHHDHPEAYRFAHNLRLCLLASGWEVAEPAPIQPDPARPNIPAAEAAGATNTDVTIRAYRLESEPLTDTPYATLCKFFLANDLGLALKQDDSLPPDLVRIVIGPKW